MYHRPTAAIGGDVRLSSRSRSVTTMMPKSTNNENQNNSIASKATNTTNTSTPSQSYTRPRRAFGDISNKKGAQSGGEKSGGNSLVLKPRPSNIEPSKKVSSGTHRSTGIQQFPSRIPKLAESKTSQKSDLPKRVHPWSTEAKRASPSLSSSTASRSLAIPSSSRQVDFILPTSTRTEAPFEAQLPSGYVKSSSDANAKALSCIVTTTELVDDVELPAGRLWVEQLRQQDIDKDDEASTSSFTNLLDSRTMWDDYKETMKNEWEEERTKLSKEDDAIFQSRIHEMIQADDHGIDFLFDFNDLSMNDGINNQLNLELLLEDDEWSTPASSVVGTLGVDF